MLILLIVILVLALVLSGLKSVGVSHAKLDFGWAAFTLFLLLQLIQVASHVAK